MSHVFISYKREDETRAGRLAQALQANGIEVWWDRGLPAGESWHANIDAKLQEAGCVLVLWTTGSAGQDGSFVREEARHALSRNVLVPVLLDPLARLPLGFGELQAIDLTRWRGDRRDPDFRDLLATIRAKLTNTPLPVPVGPTKRIARRLMWGSVSGVGLATAALVAFNAFGIASQLCTLPVTQPGLSDGCGGLGVGGRPTRTERLAWESRLPGSCPALRDHIARFPTGIHRSEAADLLTARSVTQSESWQPVTRSLALFEPAGTPAPDEPRARTSALERAQTDSERLCRDFGAGSLYRFVSAAPVSERWSCSRQASGTVCSFDGRAICALSERHRTETEHCG